MLVTFSVSIGCLREGFEHAQEYSEFDDSAEGAHGGSALGPGFKPIDSDLPEMINRWVLLPDAGREAVLAIARTKSGETTKVL